MLDSHRLGRSDIVILTCAISAGIHAALAPRHFDEGTAAGLGFLAATAVLAALAIALTLAPSSPRALAAAAAAFAALLAAYALVVTTGLPPFHPEAERLDGLALATKAVEALGLLAALGARASAALPIPHPKGT